MFSFFSSLFQNVNQNKHTSAPYTIASGIFGHPRSLSTPITSAALFDAIKTKNLTDLRTILKSNPKLLLNPNGRAKPLLHVALEEGAPEIINVILDTIEADKTLLSCLYEKDSNGWNCLHYAARYCDLKIVDRIIKGLGAHAHQEALAANYDGGKVPLFLSLDNTSPTKKTLKHHIKDITIEKTHIDLTKPILFEELLQDSTVDSKNEELLINLHYACIAASHVRKYVSIAPTHTNTNSLDKNAFGAVWTSLRRLRSDYKAVYGDIKDSDSNDLKYKKLVDIEAAVKSYHLANCGEYADLVAFTLAKLGYQNKIEVYQIQNGDHVFTVIGRKPNSVAEDFKTWGSSAVVIDAWSGSIFPASQLAWKLKNYRLYKNSHYAYRANVVFPFEPHYHKLAPYYDVELPNKVDPNLLSADEKKTFAANERRIQELSSHATKRRRIV